MANIFNDLNKLVNTVQKVDKLLTEKPKRKRIKTISLTEREVKMLINWFVIGADEALLESHNTTGHPTKNEIDEHNKLYQKLKQF